MIVSNDVLSSALMCRRRRQIGGSSPRVARKSAAFRWRLVLAWPLRWAPAMLTLRDLDGESGTSSRAARNRLICSAIPMVHSIANQVLRMQARALVSHEELVSCGLLDVVRAADAFDARRGTRFSTFAYRWIRGGMVDAIRQARDYHRVIQFQSDCGLQVPVAAEEPGVAVLDRARIRSAVGALTLRQRQIVELLYEGPGASFEAVAKVLGVKRPTVFRTNARAIRNLRSRLSQGPGTLSAAHGKPGQI